MEMCEALARWYDANWIAALDLHSISHYLDADFAALPFIYSILYSFLSTILHLFIKCNLDATRVTWRQ